MAKSPSKKAAALDDPRYWGGAVINTKRFGFPKQAADEPTKTESTNQTETKAKAD